MVKRAETMSCSIASSRCGEAPRLFEEGGVGVGVSVMCELEALRCWRTKLIPSN